MRLLIFCLCFYSSTLFAYFEEIHIENIVRINCVLLPVITTINYLQLKKHYNLGFDQNVRPFHLTTLSVISTILTKVYLIDRIFASRHLDRNSRSLKPKIIKSNYAYGIILEFELLNKTLLQSENKSDCIQLLNNSIIYPVSIDEKLKLSIDLKNISSEHKLMHLDSTYGQKGDWWFETSCISNKDKNLEKEEKSEKAVSVLNRFVLTNVCIELKNPEKLLQLEILSKYSLNVVTGEGLSKFMTINMGNKRAKTQLLNICNLQHGYFELYHSNEPDIKSALQDYILNLHFLEADNEREKSWLNTLYILGHSFAYGIVTYVFSYFVDYASFYLLAESCAICLNQVQYPGASACVYHWFCTLCLSKARAEHPRSCPLCGI